LTKNNKEEQKKGIKGVFIPGEVAFNKTLTKTDMFIWWQIDSLDCTEKHCFASNEFISDQLDLNPQTVSNSISKLKDLGYFKQVSFNGRKRVLARDDSYLEKYRHLVDKYNSDNKNRLNRSLYADYNDSYKQTKSTLIGDINKNSNNSLEINSKELINDSDESQKIFPDKNPIKPSYSSKYEIFSLRLIQFWNSFPHTSIHKIITPPTKTYQSLIKNLCSLQTGTFHKNGKQFDPEWIKKDKIPEKWFSLAWTYQELRDGIQEASKYSMEGYWPYKKREFFKSLANLIYDAHSRKSWLLAAIKNPPKLLKESSNEQWQNPFPETTKIFLDAGIWPNGYEVDCKMLARGIASLKIFSDNLVPDSYNKINHWFGTLYKLSTEYITWLQDQDWLTDIKENVIGTENGVFKKFIEDQEREIGVKIRVQE